MLQKDLELYAQSQIQPLIYPISTCQVRLNQQDVKGMYVKINLYTIACASNAHCFVTLDSNPENDQQKSKMISKLRFHAVMCSIGRLVMFYKDAKQIDDYEEGLSPSATYIFKSCDSNTIEIKFHQFVLLLYSRMLRDLQNARNSGLKIVTFFLVKNKRQVKALY